MDSNRLAAAALSALSERGFALDAAPLGSSGKSAVTHLVEVISAAVLDEIRQHGVVEVALSAPLAAWMGSGVPVPTDGGAGLKTTLIAAAQSPIAAQGGLS